MEYYLFSYKKKASDLVVNVFILQTTRLWKCQRKWELNIQTLHLF